MELFEFEFIRKAFLVGFLLALILPCIGIIIVFKRLSLVGDTLSHSSLVGVAIGMIFGINPMITSIIVCVIAALSIELIQRYIPKFKENALIIIMSFSVGLAGILQSKIKSNLSFSGYLFGSIVAVNDVELLMMIVLVVIVISIFSLFYHELFHIVLDEKSARRIGIKVDKINLIFTIITAITIALASKTIGILIVSSLLVIPILCAMKIAKSFKTTLIYAIVFSILFMFIGLYLSYYLDIRPGGSIALISVVAYIILLIVKKRS